MNKSPLPSLKIGFALSILTLLASLILMYALSVQLKKNVLHTEKLYKVVHQMDKIMYEHSFCEASVRGYIITGDEHFLIEYENKKLQLLEEIGRLDIMLSTPILENFKHLMESRINMMDEKIILNNRHESNSEAMNDLVHKATTATEAIISLKNNIEQQEIASLNKKIDNTNQLLTYAKYLIVVAGLFSVVITLITIYLLKKYLNEKQRRLEELKELDENKNKFFSLLGHDLRTPANNMVQLSKMLSHSYHYNLHKDLDKIIEMTQKSSIKLKGLLDNLLTWSASQMGKIECQQDEVNLYSSIENVIHLVEDHAAVKNIQLRNSVDKTLSVFADKNMLETILRNIIQNAIKFSHTDSEVLVDAFENDHLIDIVVQDWGMGMSQEKVDKILRMEAVSSTPGTARETGSGLGLLLCKEFLEKNAGTIRFQSEILKGTSVIVSLPRFSLDTLAINNKSYWLE